jgi:[acyl-carrier-protein] S-malonyltransferase
MSKLAFVFAGQGSQYVNMGTDLMEFDAANQVFDAALSVRSDIFDVIRGNDDDLRETVNAQYAVFTHNMAVANVLKSNGITPDIVAGFSLGEVSAVAFAGMIDLQQSFELVAKRAHLMQSAATQTRGTMAAVLKLSTEQVTKIANNLRGAWCVNFNAPGQIVVSLAEHLYNDLAAAVSAEGGRTMRLQVSGAFHSPYMKSAADGFFAELNNATLNQPQIPVIANMTAQPYTSNFATTLSQQICNPVLWQKSVENMIANGVTTFIEVGPGTVLSGLIKKISEALGRTDITILSANNAPSVQNVINTLKTNA